MSTILQAIRKYANERSELVAFRGENFTGEEQTLTYAELLDRIEDAAEVLQRQNARCIALKAENSLDWIVADLSAMLAGIAIVPIPTFFSDQQVQHVLTESGADVLIGDWQGYGEVVAHLESLPVYKRAVSGTDKILPGTGKITFTSGSTGTPKGVCLSVMNLERISTTLAAEIKGQSHRHLILLPLSTLLENVTGIYVPLLLGVTAVVFRGSRLGLSGSSQFDARAFTGALVAQRPDSLVLTPALLMALIQIVQAHPELAESLNFVAVGGARVAAELITRAHQLGIPAYEGYGLSECASVVSLNTPFASKAGSCGKVLPHMNVALSADNELLVRGNVALGYLGEPFSGEWYATGDIASLDDDGFITLQGRKKNQIITSFGRNISPEWIESQAQVFAPGCTLVVTGEAESRLSAVISPQENIADKIQKFNDTLPDYARIHRLLVVPELRTKQHWFTANGRPVREVIEHWVRQTLAEQPYFCSQTDCQLINIQSSVMATL
ncbi:long-chain fatty acid--CoA ligase [Vibrio albus]|uniref:Long-chain fatty acid--CoA ligase n=1 Tax=Vibrio albus TaxID=2200953 RepID=A0A2U3BEE5_9VIBR|nr:AMP-binding protein [Vibrio albus]PWI35150.1 long-chain fatty acid--CoA ligase [Vibrio albus]